MENKAVIEEIAKKCSSLVLLYYEIYCLRGQGEACAMIIEKYD